MDLGLRVAVVVVLLAAFVVARVAYRRWRDRLHLEEREHPRVPAEILDGADRTWVVFTTPYCATCEPVAASLRESDPSARVIKVDATAEVALADAFYVRSAPTVLLADRDGEVQARLVGAAAVQSYVTATARDLTP